MEFLLLFFISAYRFPRRNSPCPRGFRPKTLHRRPLTSQSARFDRRKQRRATPFPLGLQHGNTECFQGRGCSATHSRPPLPNGDSPQQEQSAHRLRPCPLGCASQRRIFCRILSSFDSFYLRHLGIIAVDNVLKVNAGLDLGGRKNDLRLGASKGLKLTYKDIQSLGAFKSDLYKH